MRSNDGHDDGDENIQERGDDKIEDDQFGDFNEAKTSSTNSLYGKECNNFTEEVEPDESLLEKIIDTDDKVVCLNDQDECIDSNGENFIKLARRIIKEALLPKSSTSLEDEVDFNEDMFHLFAFNLSQDIQDSSNNEQGRTLIINDKYSSEEWFKLWNKTYFPKNDEYSLTTEKTLAETQYDNPYNFIKQDNYTEKSLGDPNKLSSSYIKMNNNGKASFICNVTRLSEICNSPSTNAFKTDSAAHNLSIETYSLGEENSKIIKKIIQQYNGNIDINDENNFEDVLRLCNTDYVTVSRIPPEELNSNFQFIEAQTKLVRKDLNAWGSFRDSLELEISIHNLSIKTLIQLNRNVKRTH